MTSRPVTFLLADLGITQSHSRPHVSNDNPYSESQFKTLKYRPSFPARFASIQHARAWCQDFSPWYNHEHRHSGLALQTAASVHHDRTGPSRPPAPACSALLTPPTPNGSSASPRLLPGCRSPPGSTSPRRLPWRDRRRSTSSRAPRIRSPGLASAAYTGRRFTERQRCALHVASRLRLRCPAAPPPSCLFRRGCATVRFQA
jgi:Integrase core domain